MRYVVGFSIMVGIIVAVYLWGWNRGVKWHSDPGWEVKDGCLYLYKEGITLVGTDCDTQGLFEVGIKLGMRDELIGGEHEDDISLNN